MATVTSSITSSHYCVQARMKADLLTVSIREYAFSQKLLHTLPRISLVTCPPFNLLPSMGNGISCLALTSLFQALATAGEAHLP